MKVHPVANLFPKLEGEEFNELVADIKENGLLQKIVTTYDGAILVDGRNRLDACKLAKVNPEYERLPKSYTEQQVIAYIISANVKRRHLSASQRSMVVQEVIPFLAEAAKERQVAANKTRHVPSPSKKGHGKNDRSGRVDRQAAKMMNVGHATVAKAKKVKEASPELAKKVMDGDMTVSAAYKRLHTPRKGPSRLTWDHFLKGVLKRDGFYQMYTHLDTFDRTKDRLAIIQGLSGSLKDYAAGFDRWLRGEQCLVDTRKHRTRLTVVK